jgi:predicted TPR repeat methyltransferase
LRVINDFFNPSSAQKIVHEYGNFDVLTGSNMFAHIDDIIDVIEAAKIVLKKEGVFIFEVHYLLDLMRDFQYDTIYHEHLTYYSVLAIKNIFELHGMKIIEVQHLSMHGG